MPQLVLLGVGAMNSPRYRPAGLLVAWRGHRVMLDGGGCADPGAPPDAWLVCDAHAELMPQIRRRAAELGVQAGVGVAETARDLGVRRLVFAHIGRPAIRAIDRGELPPFGRWGSDGAVFRLR